MPIPSTTGTTKAARSPPDADRTKAATARRSDSSPAFPTRRAVGPTPTRTTSVLAPAVRSTTVDPTLPVNRSRSHHSASSVDGSSTSAPRASLSTATMGPSSPETTGRPQATRASPSTETAATTRIIMCSFSRTRPGPGCLPTSGLLPIPGSVSSRRKSDAGQATGPAGHRGSSSTPASAGSTRRPPLPRASRCSSPSTHRAMAHNRSDRRLT